MIQIEPEMDKVVESLGGVRVGSLVGHSPTFDNADYLFEREKVIAELKILTKDQFPAQTQHVLKLIEEWIAAGHLPAPKPGKSTYQTSALPYKEQRRALQSLRGPLKSVIQKANDQIKKTRSELGCHEAKGLLLLANVGNTALELEIVLYLLSSLLFEGKGGRVYSGIDRIAYFTVNLGATVPNVGVNAQVWASPWLDSTDKSLDDFLSSLGRAWIGHMESLTGQSIPSIELPASEVNKVRLRPEGVPINSSENKMLSESFNASDSPEQWLLDQLGSKVYSLRSSPAKGVELLRVVVDRSIGVPTHGFFPQFNRACRQHKVYSIYREVVLTGWPNHSLVSVYISEIPNPIGETDLVSAAIPLMAERAILERLPKFIEQMPDEHDSELCRLELDSPDAGPFEMLAPCVSVACLQAGIRLEVVAEDNIIRVNASRGHPTVTTNQGRVPADS